MTTAMMSPKEEAIITCQYASNLGLTALKEHFSLWLEYERVGYVERLSLFGLTLYRRCGQIIELLGIEWVQK